MTGGLAFVIDDEAWLNGQSNAPAPAVPFASLVNKETVTLVKLGPGFSAARKFIEETLRQHVTETGSKRAQRVLDNLDVALTKMTMVVPASEKANALAVADVSSAVGASASAGAKV